MPFCGWYKKTLEVLPGPLRSASLNRAAKSLPSVAESRRDPTGSKFENGLVLAPSTQPSTVWAAILNTTTTKKAVATGKDGPQHIWALQPHGVTLSIFC